MTTSLSKIVMMTGSRLIARSSQVISFFILARVLSPEGFGAFGVLTTAVYLIAVLGNCGVRQSMAYLIGQRVIPASDAAMTSLIAWPALSAASSVALYLYYKDQISILGDEISYILALSVSALLLITFMQGVYLGRGDTDQFNKTETLPRVLQTVFVVILFALGALSTSTAVVSFALSFVVVTPVALYFAFRNEGRGRARPRLIPGMLGRGLVFSSSLFLGMLQVRIGLFILQAQLGEAASGQLFAAQRISEIFLDLAVATGMVLFSDASRAPDPKETLKGALKVASTMFLLFAVGGVAIVVVAPLAIRLAVGAQYAQAVPALQVLGLGLGPAAGSRIMTSVISGIGRPWISASVALLGLPINVALCYLLIPAYGSAGAALALVAGQTISCVGYLLVCKYELSFTFAELLRHIKPEVRAPARLKRRR